MKEYVLENEYIKLKFLDLGGTITSLVKKNTQTNYILSYQNYTDYQNNSYYLGSLIGRSAGRTYPTYYINYDGEKQQLDANEGVKHLHGGAEGFHTQKFIVKKIDSFTFELVLNDTTSLYDKAQIKVYYILNGNRFILKVLGNSEVPTVFNVTSHLYFNLNSNNNDDGITNHKLKINSHQIQLVDESFIPTQRYEKYDSNHNQKFFFVNYKQINEAFNLNNNLSNKCNGGIDLAYYFENDTMDECKIHLIDDDGNNEMKIYSNQESCVVYTLNKISKKVKLKNNKNISKFGGITFEMQKLPNFVHNTNNCLENQYESLTVYEIL